ncbi:hypothetical protein SRB5_13580 [Streptomyces sp. RB5]|uniref:3-alpha,7-alpha, 12-alpha-trihydroxy-5-beta-cholest-24-enoyl-CoA hydratase n=1 Tax=Streptomyces smaragdinus TaxID=2585196 RepID=A0A7K0CD26_9ACTN|nr:MaoC/PaaZ C-terminal domain-containing protein [Streptomyces smaragdinus]MQY11243.1 hypothetical protein [Streptomyces smaragdinus]
MPIDAARAVAADPKVTRFAWTPADVQLYHLGIGAGRPATDPAELRYVLEDRLHVLPSFAAVAGGGMAGDGGGVDMPGIDVDLTRVLHAGQRVTLHRPIPPSGTATRTTRVTGVYDKGTAALLDVRSEVTGDDGPLWTTDSRIHVRGEGGFGGDRGPSARTEPPHGAPDRILERPTREDQALLYRLSGDYNPLHADPEFARRAGFDRPILHGLCSYGIVLKAAADTELDGDVTRIRSYATRFTGVVFPGETLRIRLWRTEKTLRLTATAADRDDAPVLTGTTLTYQ